MSIGWVRVAPVLVAAAVAASAVPAAAEGPAGGSTERVSVSTEGRQGNKISGRFTAPDISADGRVVAFDSEATNLVAEDTNGEVDVFAHDRTAGWTKLVSVSSDEVQGNAFSDAPSVDADGTLVAFHSAADNLVPGDDNGSLDVFVRDLAQGTTERISVSRNGRDTTSQSFFPDISPNGRWVAFVSDAHNLVLGDTNHVTDAFVRDRMTGTTERVSLADDGSEGNSSTTGVSISANGRWVAFSSFASNFVPGDDNGAFDVFLRDRVTGRTVLVSEAVGGGPGDGPSSGVAVSNDGRHVAFFSDATDLVPGDGNATTDIFVRDVAAGTTERVDVSSDEEEANSPSGISVHGGSAKPDISADGRYVTFESSASNLVPGDTNGAIDSFRRDRLAGTTDRVSISDVEEQADDDSSDTAVDASGLVVTFISLATNLVRRDTNRCTGFFEFGSCPDVFVRDDRPASSIG
jgi:Tol biopolymer transport system component